MTKSLPGWARGGAPLDEGCPLPLDEPFTSRTAARAGVPARLLGHLVEVELLRRVVRGVYVADQIPDTLELRAQALSLVVPESAIVTDRTAAWLHGVPILQRGAHLAIPPVSVDQRIGTRVRRSGVDGGRRRLLDRDVMVVRGVRVTTPLRTALDLGRLLWRFDALAAIDGFLRLGVRHQDLLIECDRFRGYRGVVQLRVLLPLGDGRAESPGESALRLHWYDAGLPRPELQWWVHDDDGRPRYRLDLALPDLRLAAEYDGQEHHTSVPDRAYDARRRDWLASERAWICEAFTSEDVYGRGDPYQRLRAAHRRAQQAAAERRSRSR